MNPYLEIIDLINASIYPDHEKNLLIDAVPHRALPAALDEVRALMTRRLSVQTFRSALAMLPKANRRTRRG